MGAREVREKIVLPCFQDIARHWVVGSLYLDAYFQPAGDEAAHLGGRVAASFVNELGGLQGDLPDEVGCLALAVAAGRLTLSSAKPLMSS
jgi:hypothetical protein